MTPIHLPNHSQLSHSPVCCCCIPIKSAVLFMQAAALVMEILSIFKVSDNGDRELLKLVLLIIYTAFTFAVFLFEHKGLMALHCFVCIVTLLGSTIVYIARFLIHYPSIPIQDIFGEGYLFEAFVGITVTVTYIDLCIALVNALKNKSTIPIYVSTVNPSYNTEYVSEPSWTHNQPLYPLA